MAATVHSGYNQNFSYTNSTGGNVRVIIGHVRCNSDDSSDSTMSYFEKLANDQ